MEKSFQCPGCKCELSKTAIKATGAVKMERAFTSEFDQSLNKVVNIPKLNLVKETVVGECNTKYEVQPSKQDQLKLKFQNQKWPLVPTDEFFSGRQTNKLINGTGISHIVHMYTKRALLAYSHLWEVKHSSKRFENFFKFCLTSVNNYISRKQGYFGGGGGVSGTLFVPSIHLERNVFSVLRRKILQLEKLSIPTHLSAGISTQSVENLKNLPDNSVDYIFTDPPFGESLQYAELNMFVEAWLKVKTNKLNDCVLNYVHGKDIAFYTNTMIEVFKTYSRILKPNRWITIEFHNSQNAVWSAIQQAIETSGFIVADVKVLNKKQRSFNAVNRSGAVDQDLAISAYKPNILTQTESKILSSKEELVWEFVRGHLRQLPVIETNEGKIEIITERQSFMLFDRMIAFFVQRGSTFSISADKFYQGLNHRFLERDSMYFLEDQAHQYDKKKLTVREIMQLQIAVTDELSAIHWLRQYLIKSPQTFGEINPKFMQEIGGWSKHEKMLELNQLLEQNFLMFDGVAPVPENIHAYLSSNWKEFRNLPKQEPKLLAKAKDRWYVPDTNKLGDLDKLRNKALLKEFEEYKQSNKRLKVFRLEAVRAGFKKAWQDNDYDVIISVANSIPRNVLEEDPKLLMWYEQAVTRTAKLENNHE